MVRRIFSVVAITDFCSSVNKMPTTLRFSFMPVDRELAYESLKWTAPKVYRMCLRLRYRGMSREQIKQDAESLYKLRIFMLVNNALDRIEERGLIEILNDYDNEQILFRKNQYDPKHDEKSSIV